MTPEEFWSHVDETDARLRSTFAPTGAYGLVRWRGVSTVGEWDFVGNTRVLSYARAMPAAALRAMVDDSASASDEPRVATGASVTAPDPLDPSPLSAPASAPSDPFDVHVHWRAGDSREVVSSLRRRDDALRARTSAWYRPVSPTEHLPDRIVDIKVDGRREPFEVWVRGAVWWAATMLGGRTLAVSARDVPFEDIAFTRVTDVEPYLEGRRSWIRHLRGGT
jgi:hypothetical protein